MLSAIPATARSERSLYARPSRRKQFLETMETVVPWPELEAPIVFHDPRVGNGRQPAGLPIMLRAYFLQVRFNLSDPAVEEVLYESAGSSAASATKCKLNLRTDPCREEELSC